MAAQDIITAAEAKAYMGVSGSGKDTIIGTFISEVSLWLEEYLGRKIVGSQTITTEIGNGTGTEIYVPKYLPVTSVTTLKSRGSPSDTFATLESTSANILIDNINGDYVELYASVFPAGRANIEMTYVAGYASTPNELKQVAYEMVAHRFKESNDTALGDDRLGRGSKSISQGGVNHSKTYIEMMDKWEKALRPYRTRRVITRGSSIVSMGR